MTRAAYISRRDGRYWFQKRFAVRAGPCGHATSHMRLALRTGDYPVALRRMVKVLYLLSEYEVQSDLVGRAQVMMEQMRRFNMRLSDPEGDQLVERKALETLVSRLIDEARWRDHPLTTDPEGFWHAWIVFCSGNIRIESEIAQHGQRPVTSVHSAPSSAADIEQRQSGALADACQGVSQAPATTRKSALLSEVRGHYLAQRLTSDGDGRAEEDVGIVIDFLIDFLGDREISSLAEDDFLSVENALPDIPHPAKIPKESAISLYARWKYAQQVGWDDLKRISKTRLKDGWHRSIHAFFDWSRSKGFYVGPVYKFTLVGAENAEANERDAWQPAEILKLFSLPLFTGAQSATRHWQPGSVFVQSHLYWAYLMIFFMGYDRLKLGAR